MKMYLQIGFVVYLLLCSGSNGSGDVISPIDQSQYYQGTPDECWRHQQSEQPTQNHFKESIPSNLSSATVPLYFAIGVHIEPHRDYLKDRRFEQDRERILKLAQIVKKRNGKLTIQAQSPFTEKAVKLRDHLLSQLANSGHEIALHFHEEVHLPNANDRPPSDWVAAFRKEIGLIEKLSGKPVFTWSGGNLYPYVFDAAAQAGLQSNINYKNPKTQATDSRFLILTPWRPAGGESIGERTTHDPQGAVIYVPSGVFPAHCQKAETFPHPYHYEAFDYVTVGLRNSLDAVTKGKVNTFIATLHPGDFGGAGDDEQEFEIWEEWLTRVIDPLVQSGRVVWATVHEMAEAFMSWEDEL